jgi:2-dehydro-3-deoxyglucarate aldolase/4-hydroxy-2-oxoheptanedioate aldolase
VKPNKFQQVLRSGGIPIGHMLMEFGTRGIAKILAAASVDFAVIDMEHSGFDLDRVADLLAWFKSTEVTAFVRVPQPQHHFVARAMDAGAQGIMVPNVESREQAQTIVAAAKYAPLGKRGVGVGIAHDDYIAGDLTTTFREANENTTVICQIESVAGIENIDAIAAAPGADVLWLGHYDLSQSMGIAGEFGHPRLKQAIAKILQAATRHGKIAAVHPGRIDLAEEWLAMGFRSLCWKVDIGLFRDALAAEVIALRKLASVAPPPARHTTPANH